jgi:hypothetical protein
MDSGYGIFLRFLKGHAEELETEKLREIEEIVGEILCNRANGNVETAIGVNYMTSYVRGVDGKFFLFARTTETVKDFPKKDNKHWPEGLRDQGPEWPSDSTFGRPDGNNGWEWRA